MSRPVYALSIKQPWAGLVVLGIKTIEVRRWATSRRGTVLIHAARIDDDRPEGWDLLPADWSRPKLPRGGIIGQADLQECISYRDAATFAADAPRHRNHPDWFQGPVLYGFCFANPVLVPFRRLKGQVRFFTVG
jgi:hypothetical protein